MGWCALAVALATWNTAALAGDEDALAKAAKESNGTFRLVSQLTDGQPRPEEEMKGLRMILSDGKWTVTRDNEFVSSGTFKVVAVKDGVRQVEGATDKGENAGRSSKHISKQEGDKLTICRAPEGLEIPREFASKPGTGHVLSVWMREKP
jgi:uncharacterized protein (TIGR03067 family)